MCDGSGEADSLEQKKMHARGCDRHGFVPRVGKKNGSTKLFVI